MKKPAKKKPAKKPSTALAVRRPKAPSVVISDPHRLLPQHDALLPVGQLGELATVGALGLAEVALTAAEEAVLARAVNPADILVRDGGIAYLPHIVYTRWFNEAFGRTGWAIVPTAKPQKAGSLVIMPYLLYIHGKPVAYAMGEQEYHENNSRQTYGDVIESTVASALRRCAKRLGVGLEMWDKAWLAQWAKGTNQPARREDFVEPTPPSMHIDEDGKLSIAQRERLSRIATKANRNPADVSLWFRRVYGVSNSRDLKQSQYVEICKALEARGPLPMPGDGAE